MKMTNEFDNMLNLDPLLEAEKITGQSYKDDEETLSLGMLLHMAKSKQVREELSLRNDTHFGISWTDALAIYEDLGFVEVFSEEFVDKGFYKKDPEKTEVFKVFWRNGFLLTAESYSKQTTLNSSNLYYNWIPNDEKSAYHHTSSGHYDKNSDEVLVWSGDHDAREGLRNIISNLESNGEILDQWQFVPWLWFLNFSVTKEENYDYRTENTRVISHFPAEVQGNILFGKRS